MDSKVLKTLVDAYLNELVKCGLNVEFTDIPIVSLQHPNSMYIGVYCGSESDDISLANLVKVTRTMWAHCSHDIEAAEIEMRKYAKRLASTYC